MIDYVCTISNSKNNFEKVTFDPNHLFHSKLILILERRG